MDDRERRALIRKRRGAPLGPGRLRNFCHECEVPMEVDFKRRNARRLLCSECYGNKVFVRWVLLQVKQKGRRGGKR